MQNLLSQLNLTAEDIQYTTNIQMTVWLATTAVSDLQQQLTERLNGQLQFDLGPQQFNEVPISAQDLHQIRYQ